MPDACTGYFSSLIHTKRLVPFGVGFSFLSQCTRNQGHLVWIRSRYQVQHAKFTYSLTMMVQGVPFKWLSPIHTSHCAFNVVMSNIRHMPNALGWNCFLIILWDAQVGCAPKRSQNWQEASPSKAIWRNYQIKANIQISNSMWHPTRPKACSVGQRIAGSGAKHVFFTVIWSCWLPRWPPG